MRNLWAVLFFFLPAFGFAGGAVGNGGDSVECTYSAANDFNGTYALDYLLTYKESNQNSDIVKVTSLDESIQRIKKLLQEKVPELSDSFDEFMKLVRNEDISLPRFWEEAPFGLVDIKDENIINFVPMNCRQNGDVKIVQTIIRLNPMNTGLEKYKLVYKYVPSIFQRLYTQAPLQLSFLLVHEWLWDLSHHVEKNRRLNRFIHSKEFESLSREQLRARLTTLGLEIPNQISPDIFRFDSCKPSPSDAKELMSRIKTGGQIILSQDLSLLQRKFKCPVSESVGGCLFSSVYWHTVSKEPQSRLTGSVDSQGGKNLLLSTPKTGVSRCEVDEESAVISCKNLNLFPQPQKETIFTGTVGSGCIKFYDSVFYQGAPYGELVEKVLKVRL